MSNWRIVEHDPRWEPAQLPINAAGDTKPGFICTHELENGNGLCGGNVFALDEAIGTHACVVHSDEPEPVPSDPWYRAFWEVRESDKAELALAQAERDQYKRRYDELLATMQGGPTAKAALRTMTAARDQLGKELAAMEAERNKFRFLWLEYENAVNWGTSCLSCSKVLDSAYEQTVAAEKALAARNEWERQATDSAELAKATREKLREAHSDVFKLATHIRECERQLEDAHSRLARYEAQCVGCTTETFDGAPGSVKLNADATCPVHGELAEMRASLLRAREEIVAWEKVYGEAARADAKAALLGLATHAGIDLTGAEVDAQFDAMEVRAASVDPARIPACQVDVWDGPYKMTCGHLMPRGECITHGKPRA